MPLNNQPVYRKMFGEMEDKYPVANWLNASGFYIGCHQYLAAEDREYIAKTIFEYYKEDTGAGSLCNSDAFR
jgi:dTDP-4-amino-4,6-dideoxygalactose transaminase